MRRRRNITFILLILAALLVLPGCWVMSVYPLYEGDERQPADPGLAGQWWQPEGDCRLSITLGPTWGGEQRITLDYSVPPQGAKSECAVENGGGPIELFGRLVDLDGHMFLDVMPSRSDLSFQTIRTHSVFRVTLNHGELDLVPLDPEFVAKAIRERKLEGLDVDTGSKMDELVVTSRTSELRKFVLSVVDDVSAFPEVIDGRRYWHFTRMPAGLPPRTPTQKPECGED